MITQQDKEMLAQKGISEQQIAEQLACFEKEIGSEPVLCIILNYLT